MGVVIVEPDAIHVERGQDAAKLIHSLSSISDVIGADALPAVRRRRRSPIRAKRSRVRMFL
jgi:hypothetical protein